MNLFNNNSSIGIEMDAKEIRAVELRGNADKPILRSWGRIALEPGIIHDGMVQEPQKLGETLRNLFKTNKFKSKKVILSILNQGVIVRKADFPVVPSEKIEGLIKHQASNYLPLSPDNFVIDYMTIGQYKNDVGDRNEILLVAAQLDMVNNFIDAVKYANVKLYDLTVSPLSLLKILPSDITQGTLIVVDIAKELGGLLGAINGTPRFVRSLKLKLHDIMGSTTSVEAQVMHINEEQLDTLIQALYNEIRYFINYFLAEEKINRIDKIVLTGWGSRVKGIKKSLGDVFEVPIEVYDPVESFFKLAKNSSSFKEQAADFAVCIGTAIAGLKE